MLREKIKKRKKSNTAIRKYLSAALCTSLIFTGFSAAVPVQAKLFKGIKWQSSAKKASTSNAKMLNVVMPTGTDNVFDFIMDPQGLIQQTDGAAYNYSSFEEDASLFFKRSDGESDVDYSRFSDSLTIINKGEDPIEIELTAYLSPSSIDGIVLTDDETFTDDSYANLYLALTDGETTAAIDEEEGALIHVTLEGSSGEDDYSSYSFQLTGAVNQNADWSELKNIEPKVTVSWKIRAEEDELEEDSSRTKQTLEQEILNREPAEKNVSESLSPDGQKNTLEEIKEEEKENPEEVLPAEDAENPEGGTAKENESVLATPSTISK